MAGYKVRNDKGQEFDVDEDKIHEAEKDGYLPVVSNGKEEHRVSLQDMPMAMKDGFSPKQEGGQEEGIGKRMTRSALGALPIVGGMVGSGLGGAAGLMETLATGGVAAPLAYAQTLGGAGLGYSAGTSLKNLGEQYLLGDQKTIEGNLKDAAMAIPEGVAQEMTGMSIAAIPRALKGGYGSAKNFIANKIGGPDINFTPRPDMAEIEAAGSSLGLNIPKGMLTDNPTYQKLESGLSQSGSLPAKSIREQYGALNKGLSEATEKISSMRSPDSDFSLGSSIQEELAKNINANKTPVSEMYNELTPHMREVPVNKGVVNKTFGVLKRNPIFLTRDGQDMLNEYKSIALKQPELASLKEWRSTVGEALGPNASPLDEKRVSAIRNAITSIRDNSIEAIKTELPKSQHGEVDDLISQITLADKAHASNINDVNSIKGLLGNKEYNSPSGFLNKLGDLKEGDLAQRASNLDISSLRNMQQKFPTIFEKAKTAKINDMIQSSTNAISGFSDAKFLKQYEGMDQELKDLIFDSKIQDHINSLKTIRQAVPEKLGKSGTPEGQMMMDMFNPKRNVLDYGIKKTLESPSASQYYNNMINPNPELSKAPATILRSGSSYFNDKLDGIKQDQTPQNFNDSHNKEAMIQKTQGTKYQQVLANAAQKGDASFAAAHYVLANSYPKYRELIDNKQGEK